MKAAQAELFAVRPPRREAGEIETAVIAALKDIEDAGMLTAKIRALGVTLKKSAAAADIGLESGRVSVATSQLVKQLIESLEKLPETKQETGTVFDTLQATIQEMTMKVLA
ncbi:hypothetical protein [Trueperella pyogenes]|nr:hypothetical protein [Trueperella pyogenes]MCI7688938.1 hypothetical protein [Trueperella pyogenes]